MARISKPSPPRHRPPAALPPRPRSGIIVLDIRVLPPSPSYRTYVISCNKQSRSLCHACQLGRHSRLPFGSSTSVTTSTFELLHSDVWTSPVLSTSGFKYYLVLLDDFSLFYMTFMLCHKSKVHRHLVEFIAFAHTQFSITPKAF